MHHCHSVLKVAHAEIPCTVVGHGTTKATPKADILTHLPVSLLIQILKLLFLLTDSDSQSRVLFVYLLSGNIGVCGQYSGEWCAVILIIFCPFIMNARCAAL
ncbi:unknown [Prevotella sp. CAG:873]|nr:unknown [Prevotella sp. CAG:873]